MSASFQQLQWRVPAGLRPRLRSGISEGWNENSDRGKTVTKPSPLKWLGLPLSEKQIPQVIENVESGDKRKETSERTVMRPTQVRYQAALRPDN